jgi:hypothetical protein
VPFCTQSKPSQLHGFLDGVDVLLLFLLGVGVVEAQVAGAAVGLRQAEVQADALGVADVQVAVGLGREARADARRVQRTGLVVGGVAGLPPKCRWAQVPASRSRSMMPRRKLLGCGGVCLGVGSHCRAGACRGVDSIEHHR